MTIVNIADLMKVNVTSTVLRTIQRIV